ncbi:Maestro heat-like repeat-containing protein family member [Trichinella spiralis]|uniref:Maestro heat-like repeat-containing protein family member n=1 Tax=Trichinella spiralis TaxID=6334 RepID=A0ABR3KN77_TRISP
MKFRGSATAQSGVPQSRDTDTQKLRSDPQSRAHSADSGCLLHERSGSEDQKICEVVDCIRLKTRTEGNSRCTQDLKSREKTRQVFQEKRDCVKLKKKKMRN